MVTTAGHLHFRLTRDELEAVGKLVIDTDVVRIADAGVAHDQLEGRLFGQVHGRGGLHVDA